MTFIIYAVIAYFVWQFFFPPSGHGHTPPNAIPVVFRGEEYPSIAAACRAHGVSRAIVQAEGEFDC